jgi:hypothetical protein
MFLNSLQTPCIVCLSACHWRCAQLKVQIAKRARPWRHVVCIAPTLAQQFVVRGNDMTSMEWCQIQAFLKHTHSPWFIWSAWVLSSHLSTTWPCCKLDCLSDTPGYAAARSENQTSTTCSWSENSRFSWIGALWPHSWWIASFFRFSALKRSDHVGMLRRAATNCRRGVSCKMRPICRGMSQYTCYTNIRLQTFLSNAVLRKYKQPMIDCKRLAFALLSGHYLTIL